MALLTARALAGYLLEEALAHLLYHSGYRLLRSELDDPDALRQSGHGLLVRGRGADHQADVLGDLVVPSPFSHPVRLFVEAKNRSSKVGLAEVRNAHGVIHDVNEYYSSAAAARYAQPLRRYLYRYVLFSAAGFARDAQDYALAQHISLIDLSGPAFSPLVTLADLAAADLRGRAVEAHLRVFPLGQVRRALRAALDALDGDREHTPVEPVQSELVGFREAALSRWAKDFVARLAATGLGQELILGFPAAPFILVLRPDDITAFAEYAASHQHPIDVNIRFTGRIGIAGDWSITPSDGSHGFRFRFGLPGALESWLLEDSSDLARRAVRAKTELLNSISLFLEDQLVRLRFEPVIMPDAVRRRERDHDVPATDAATDAREGSFLRRELSAPEPGLSAADLIPTGRSSFRWDEPSGQEWNAQSVRILIDRLDSGNYPQAEMIREAARRGGEIQRADVYRIAGYPPQRTLRGLTRPSNRITAELISEDILSADVEWPFFAWYEAGVLATHFIVPPDVVRLLQELKML